MAEKEQTQHICQGMELQVDRSSESTDPCAQSKEHNPSETSETSGVIGIDQFLRQRDEPESVSSDASEQGSVRLEPLTPSEVLEYEATEILHKADDPSANNNDTVSDQTCGSHGGSSPSRAEAAVDLTDGKEKS